MAKYKLGEMETAFAELIWGNEPVSSSRLVELCGEELNWKKSTTYTVLRRLCQRGIFQNQGGRVTSLLSREEFFARRSEEFVDESFGGSLPKFLAAFTSGKTLTGAEIEELQRFIDARREERG